MTEPPGTRRSRARRVIPFLVAALLIAIFAGIWVAGRKTGNDTGSSVRVASRSLDPAAFERRTARPGAFVVNVHVPYAGEIAGTDAFIPYDRIVGDRRLPPDTRAEILLYCRSGRMSAIAAKALVAAGYTNVADLAGGMDAWRASGRPLLETRAATTVTPG